MSKNGETRSSKAEGKPLNYGVTRKELDQFGKAVDEHIAHERREGKIIRIRKR
jgi:hypothetical protein